MYDVLIVGAGICGAMIARELMKYQLNVCIVEKSNDVGMGATKANSSIVHAGFDAKTGSMKARLNVRGSELMPKVADELGVKYENNGSIVIGFDDTDKEILQKLYAQGTKNGVKGLKLLERDKLITYEPNISKNAKYALYAPTGAIVCPYELCIAAIGNAMDNGAKLKLNFEVTNIEYNDGIYEVYSHNTCIKSKCVINSAGIYADKIAKMIGDNSFEIHPRRGEYILLDKECGCLAKHTIFKTPSKMGKGILITHTVDNNLLLGPTSVDILDKECTDTTAGGFSEIITAAKKYIGDIPLNKTISSFCGLRAVSDTGDFIINSPKNNFINVAGIESPGLSASPAIAEYVVDLLKTCDILFAKNESFNPIRKSNHAFRDMTIDMKNTIIKNNPSYGKIICRCESITEGEIIDAIHQNPGATDVDGIKRRTRSGMGRCQGGFCLPYVAEILSRELQIPYEEVTKSGGKSQIIIGRTKGGNSDD